MLESGMRLAPKSLVLAVCASTFLLRAQEAFVGSIKTADGGSVVRRGASTVPTRVGLHLLLNDVLITSADGRLGVILEDGTRISLGPNTELTIDRFVYQPAEGKFGLLLRLG